MAKIKKPTDKEYRSEKIRQMARFSPEIFPCVHCGWPVADGYCCWVCGSSDPKGG